ncbi:MAG: class I SAM-dependent methyltransferase [Sedimentisphaerales bacterium]|nr:class I SAM-dependent methyltransferase [Sedimentisphaerales bacterium]
MKIIEGKRVTYDSDEEFYAHQARRSKRHDNNRLVKGRIAEALRFLVLGGNLDYTDPPVKRADPGFAPDVRILDMGCEDGWSLEYLKRGCPEGFTLFGPKKKFLNTYGIEMIHKVVEYARSKGRNVIQGDIRYLVIEENAFDLVYTRHCLEHLDDPLKALKNITKMLKPGGTLLAIVPKESQDINPQKSVHSYQFRNDDELARLVTNAGMTVTQSFCRNGYTYRKRKYWYRLSPPLRRMTPELWVFATK